ncbi:hypothetical protein FFA01_16640 [Frigoribacterium faeni]|uniref:Uncharacterized protein n=1 Tax=Frigoribacterium faeni TaxID=145483 RepID=A0ABQ0UPD6_9MICO|nr:hypothetical protein GCM10025699_63050 [Microbacterium flavescens]GEK83355.1 hypothetical protein FFA01_16640 [Frigoribacterium faeni]
MYREVELTLLPGLAWPLRENILYSPENAFNFAPEEYGLSKRLTTELYEWVAAWEARGQRSTESHVAWGNRIARDLRRELGSDFKVTYLGRES